MTLNESIVEDAALCDTLLPKLLSGELSMAGLESQLAGTDAESAPAKPGNPCHEQK